jgi:hypothetical protein
MDITVCPCCKKGKMQLHREIPKVRRDRQTHLLMQLPD